MAGQPAVEVGSTGKSPMIPTTNSDPAGTAMTTETPAEAGTDTDAAVAGPVVEADVLDVSKDVSKDVASNTMSRGASPADSCNDNVMLGGLPVSRWGFAATLEKISEWMASSQSRRIATANLDFLRLTAKDAELSRCLEGADLVTADGMPLVWLSRLAGRPVAERVAGSDLVPALLQRAAQRGWRVYFLGGAKGTAEAAALRAKEQYEGLQVAGAQGPRVDLGDEDQTRLLVEEIRKSRCDLLLVGLGCPKQELFLERYVAASGARVGIGIGGSFDFVSGRRRRAPQWLGRLGLEWAWRMMLEPRRLGGRYAASLLALPRLATVSLFQRWKDDTP